MFGLEPRPIRYEALSAIMFLKPEVASVGLNELKAREQKVPYRVEVVANRPSVATSDARDERIDRTVDDLLGDVLVSNGRMRGWRSMM